MVTDDSGIYINVLRSAWPGMYKDVYLPTFSYTLKLMFDKMER
jgi:inosine/xanthosine triphosphate pyrophosphatase family protein